LGAFDLVQLLTQSRNLVIRLCQNVIGTAATVSSSLLLVVGQCSDSLELCPFILCPVLFLPSL
jgi:hypothetical protein